MSAIRYGRPQDSSNTAHFPDVANASDDFTYSDNDPYDAEVLKWDLLASWTKVDVSPEDKGLVARFVNAVENNLSTPGSDEVANCAIDIIMPLLGNFSEEERRWMKREIKNICSEVEGCIAKPYRRPAEHRYITFIDERDTSRWKYDAIDSERMWFDVTYTAGIEGLPVENDVINTRTSHIANVHHLLVSLLLHLVIFHTPSLNYRDLGIQKGVWVIQTILRWAGRLKGGHYDLEDDTPEKDSFAYHMAVGHLPDIDRAFREHYAQVEIMLRQLYWQHEQCSSDDSSDDQEMVDEFVESSSNEEFYKMLQKYLDCFYSLLGRRILILAISFYGRGYQLRETMETVKSWKCADFRQSWESADPRVYNFESGLLSSRQLQVGNTKSLHYPHRVIDITTLEFETEYSFYENCYAIFSHTWSQRELEISFQEAQQVLLIGKINRLKKLVADLKNRQGFQAAEKLRQATMKIAAFRAKAEMTTFREKAQSPCSSSLASKKLLCAIEAARKLGYRYIWLDNCCINKTKESEVIEAIPNMGNWYRRAQVCLVYLEDFYQSKIFKSEPYAKSVRWATRSWTLQEIVLCRSAVIYNRFWEILYDSRTGTQIPPEVPYLCGVPERLFCCGQPPPWPAHVILELAAHRKATKPEDKVYSLLGILGVLMKPEYGEGLPAAIARLFEVIVETKNDTSVFNWRDTHVTAYTAPGHSMFPSDLVRYMYFSNLIQHHPGNSCQTLIESSDHEAKSAFTITSAGIRTQFDVFNIARVDISPHVVSTFKSIKQIVKKSAGTLPSLVYVHCNIVLDLVGDGETGRFLVARMDLGVDLRCDVSLLSEKSSSTSTNIWLLARFAKVETSHWFILQIANFTTSGSQLRLAQLRKQAVESSGLHARRIGVVENTRFKQAYRDYCAGVAKRKFTPRKPAPETLELIVE